MSSFRRDAMSVLTSNTASFVLNFLGGILLARALGPEGKGALATLLAVPYILMPLCDLGVGRSVVHMMGRKLANERQVVSSLLVLFCITLAVGNISIVVLLDVAVQTDFSDLLVMLTVSFFSLHMLLAYARGVFLGRAQLSRFNRSQWMVPFLRLLSIALLVYFLGMGVEGALLSESIALLAVAFVLLRKERWSGFLESIRWSVVGRLLRLGLAFSLTTFLLTALFRIDVLMLERMTTLAEAGAYSLAVNVGEVLWQLPGAVGLVVLMRTAHDSEEGRFASAVPQLVRMTLFVCLLAALVFAVLAPYLIEIVYGAAFERSAPMLRWMLPGIAGFAVFKILSTALTGEGRPLFPVLAIAPALVGNVLLNLFLIPRYQGEGAAMATTISYVGASGVLLLLYCWERRLNPLVLLFLQGKDLRLALGQLRDMTLEALRFARLRRGTN